MDEDKKNLKEAWWKQGVTLFSEVSSWIVGPIILALIFGKMLDNHYGTKPWIFLGLTGLSFLVSCYGIFKIVSRYMKSIEESQKSDQGKNIE